MLDYFKNHTLLNKLTLDLTNFLAETVLNGTQFTAANQTYCKLVQVGKKSESTNREARRRRNKIVRRRQKTTTTKSPLRSENDDDSYIDDLWTNYQEENATLYDELQIAYEEVVRPLGSVVPDVVAECIRLIQWIYTVGPWENDSWDAIVAMLSFFPCAEADFGPFGKLCFGIATPMAGLYRWFVNCTANPAVEPTMELVFK